MQANASINEVARAIQRCRSKGIRVYPAAVWSAIAALREHYSVSELSGRLGISTQYLAKRVGKGHAQFYELPSDAVPGAMPSGTLTEIIVRRADGSEMAVRTEKSFELSSVVMAFAWNRSVEEDGGRP